MAWECPVCDNGSEPAHDHSLCINVLYDALGTARAAMGDDDLPFLDDGITRLRTRLHEAEAQTKWWNETALEFSARMETAEARIERLERAARAALPLLESCAGKTNAGLETVSRLRAALETPHTEEE